MRTEEVSLFFIEEFSRVGVTVKSFLEQEGTTAITGEVVRKVRSPIGRELGEDTFAHGNLQVGHDEVDLCRVHGETRADSKKDAESDPIGMRVPGVHSGVGSIEVTSKNKATLKFVDEAVLIEFAFVYIHDRDDTVGGERVFKRKGAASNKTTDFGLKGFKPSIANRKR